MHAHGARERVFMTLARQPQPLAIRTLAVLAEVSPATAKRIGDELVHQARARHHTASGSRERHLELTAAGRAQLRAAYGPRPRWTPTEEVAYMRRLAARGAPIYVGDGLEWKAYGIRVKAPFVMLPARWRDLFELDLPTITLRASRPLEMGRLTETDWFVALLKLDPKRAARMLAQMRTSATFQRRRQKIKRRLRQEGLVGAAQTAGLPTDARRREAPPTPRRRK